LLLEAKGIVLGDNYSSHLLASHSLNLKNADMLSDSWQVPGFSLASVNRACKAESLALRKFEKQNCFFRLN